MAETLVVISKVKKTIKDKYGMNTAANVIEKLTDIIERECDAAAEKAKKDRRKTIMNRDFE